MAVAKKMWVSAIAGVLATGFTVGLIGQRLQAQEIIIDPSVPGLNSTTLHSSGGGKPQIDIATPDSGVSHNKFQKYNVGPGGLILNNSATGGTSVIGGSVNANSNLATSGPASVILNEVTGTGTSSLTGITEIFGGKASVIIANPNGVGCNGCSFINTNRSTLTTGVPTVTGSQIDLLATRGTVSVGSGGFTSEGDADIIGRHVTIGGPVNADTTLTISGGAQNFNYNAGTSQAAPTTNAQQSPFAVDATSLGALTAGNIRIHGNEVGLGVNAYGNINAAGNLNLSSKGNIHYGNIQSTGTGQIDGQGSVRQYGNAQFDGSVTVSGNDFTLYRDRTLSAGGDVTINTDDFAVVIGEISGTNVNINVDGKFT
ncbi:MAG: filamentous hemagglutinin N-terminal domain-containing protein, partial [Pseudomonadota bacterium]